jgi:hypothetical protein
LYDLPAARSIVEQVVDQMSLSGVEHVVDQITRLDDSFNI